MKICGVWGCTKQAQSGGVCWGHGAVRRVAKKSGVCSQHRAGAGDSRGGTMNRETTCFPSGRAADAGVNATNNQRETAEEGSVETCSVDEEDSDDEIGSLVYQMSKAASARAQLENAGS